MQGRVSNVGFGSQNIRNVVRDERKKKIQVSDAQAGLDLLSRLKEESGGKFFVKTQMDGENRLKNLVWVDPKCLMAYSNFGDVVAFDTTYQTNRYAMPFVPFTGVNHHYQSVLFGFALMRDEVKTSFEWVLKTWLEAVGDKHPNSIITDQDQAMAGAIASILPKTRHLLCSWHISQKFPKKLKTLYIKHPGTFKVDFNKYIYHSLTEDIFQERWNDLVVKYDLKDHSWLQGLYLLEEKWISAYTKSTFSAGQNTTSRSEGMNAFFDSYISSSTGLKEFVEKAQKAIDRQFMQEKEEDNDTKNKTRYMRFKTALEQDGASVYTKEMFRQFQIQLVEASEYFVEKDKDLLMSGDEVTHYRCFRPLTEVDKRTMYEVKFNKVAILGTCVCRMYEHLGIPCRHIIVVFNKKNVGQIPVTFIKRRWTRDANRVNGLLPYAITCDDPTYTELTPNQRFNHMTLLTMSFCHSSMVSKERYEYALEVMNREIANLEKIGVDVDVFPNTSTEIPIEQNIGHDLNEPVLDLIVSQTKGRKKPQRFKNPIEGLSKKKRKCKQCHEEGHDIRTCKKLDKQIRSSQINGGKGEEIVLVLYNATCSISMDETPHHELSIGYSSRSSTAQPSPVFSAFPCFALFGQSKSYQINKIIPKSTKLPTQQKGMKNGSIKKYVGFLSNTEATTSSLSRNNSSYKWKPRLSGKVCLNLIPIHMTNHNGLTLVLVNLLFLLIIRSPLHSI
ncbi:hypothetical protein DCAR_0519850 [Daucus carota subsp. sativus]|uniref:SWIM-type domain-containing protein n=1 Tax=Daucus carota subsp. sativus TaxID=79200 RepID=A0AAF1B1V2_DAUCS|nr:hypothetical protein DCAR_0519850 [Daucus carota subsp. sativus]